MNETITIKVSERTRGAFTSATRYQKEVAIRRFGETLEMSEQQLYPTAEDIEESFNRIDKYHEENNISPIENLHERLERYKAKEMKRIAEIGEDAYIQELEAFEDGS